MVVYDLVCERDHPFEGWFDSMKGFEDQQGRGLVSCPVCNSSAVVRRPAVPRINIGKAPAAEPTTPVAMTPNLSPAALWRNMLSYIRKNTEDVGPAFAEEARKIHYGEAASRNIRGQASSQEVAALNDEGIEVTPLPHLPYLPDKLQ